MTRPTLAVTVIAKNEINNIDRLTKSIEGCFDQYIFVDTGSTDGTIERALELGWQVEQFEWIKDFSAARNHALQFVKTDYWMWMDLDDSLGQKDAFIKWRDTVMVLADVWMADYWYALNPEGQSVCTFLRERVFKTSLQNVKWVYSIHEGVVPPAGSQVQWVRSWHINHHRTLEDMMKDKGRNLDVFERMISDGADLVPRLQYYYGKELFEANRPLEAQEWLLKASVCKDLEFHDRLLAIQYACYALMKLSKWDVAMVTGFQGIQIEPKRAEFHCIVSDCYAQMGRFSESMIFANSAKACEIPVGPQVLFQDQTAYSTWPRNQRAKILSNMQRFDEAEIEAAETVTRFPNNESKAILEDIRKQKYLTIAMKNGKPCDDIVFTCPPQGAYLWDSKIYKTKAMGGSETAAIEMSQRLARISGRKVIIFNPRPDVYKDEFGVEYRPVEHIQEYMIANRPWMHVAWRHNMKVTNAPTFLWCHDLFTPGAEVQDHYNKHLCLTPFHKSWAMANQGLSEDKIFVTRNGLVSDRFNDGPWEKDPLQFVFSSSPDRGLDRAMIVLDKVRKVHKDAKLSIYYGWEHLDKYGHTELRKKLESMLAERPWVSYRGATEQKVLMREFKNAAYCIQPSDWIETSCISALERASCGVYQVMRAVGGVVDTLMPYHSEGMAKLVYSDCLTDSQHELYANEVIKAIDEEAYKRVNVDARKHDWDVVAQEWLNELPKFM